MAFRAGCQCGRAEPQAGHELPAAAEARDGRHNPCGAWLVARGHWEHLGATVHGAVHGAVYADAENFEGHVSKHTNADFTKIGDTLRHDAWLGVRVGEAANPGPVGPGDTISALLAGLRHDAWLGTRVGEASNPGPKHPKHLRSGLTKGDVRRLVKTMVFELASQFFGQHGGMPFGPSAVTAPVQAPSAWEQKGKAKGKGTGTPRDLATWQDGRGQARGKGPNATHDISSPSQRKGQAQGKDAGAKGEHAGFKGLLKGNKGSKGADFAVAGSLDGMDSGACRVPRESFAQSGEDLGLQSCKGEANSKGKGASRWSRSRLGPESSACPPGPKGRRWQKGWQTVRWQLRAGDLNFSKVVTDAETLEKDLDSGEPVLAFAEDETQLQEFSGLMRGGCHADSLLVFSGEACAVTDSLAQDFPVERRSLPGQLRGQLKLRRCWVVAWHRGKPTLGDLPLDVEVDFIKTKAPAKRNLREESVVVRASSFQRFATADRWKKVQHRPGAQLRDWAARVGVPPADILDTWGWERGGSPDDGVIKGLMRLSPTAARALVAAGGRSLGDTTWFLQPLRWQDLTLAQPALLWQAPLQDEAADAYLRRVVSSSHDQGLHFDGRRLALRVDPRDPRNAPRPTVWNLRHAPALWHVEEIEEVLHGVGFTQVEVLAKSRDRRNVSWTFRAMRNDRREYVPIVVEDEEGPFELEAARQRRKPKDAPTQPIRDARRQSVSFDLQELLCPTAAKGGGKAVNSKRKGTGTPARTVTVTAASADAATLAPTSGLDLLDLDLEGRDEDTPMAGAATFGSGAKRSVTDSTEAPDKDSAKKPRQPLKATLPAGAVIEENEGQGNCLPAAIAQALSEFTGRPRSHRGVRRSMVEWMRAHSLHLQPLWDQRNVKDETTTCSFVEYLSQVEQVNAYCGFLEVYALSKGLPANILVIDETAGHHIRFASQSDADPFIVLRFAAKHYEWVRCDAAALVEIWTGAAAGKTVGGRGGGTTEVCRTSATDSPLQSPRFMQVSTDSEAESSGQAKAGDPQSLTQADGVEAGPPFVLAGFMQVPTDTEAEYPHQAHVAGPQTFMQIDSASEIGTTAHGPAKRPSQDPEIFSATCKRQRMANSVCSLQTCTSAVPTKPNSTTVAAGARKPARDTWTWFCELCRFTVRAPTKGQASQGRNNHLNRVHPSLSKEERAKLHKVRVEAEVVTPYKGELQVGGWMCFNCKRVLPPLSHSDRQASIRMHMKSCYGSRCPSHGENARRVFVSMGGTCNKGKKPSPKAFSTAIVVNKKLRELRETSPHRLQLVGSFGRFYAITCLKCCARWKNLYCCLQDHRNPVCCRDNRATNLQRFAKQRGFLPKGVPKLFLETWKLRPSEAALVRPCASLDPTKVAASAGHDLVCIQGESRQANSVKAGYRRCFTCRTCTQQWRSKAQVLQKAKQTPCGAKAREKALRAKVRFWARMSPKWRSNVAKAWSLSCKEKRALDAAVMPTRRKDSWIRDLTQENIHPHPGPSLSLWSLNSQGAAHAWKLLDKIEEERPHVVAWQEPNLDPAQAEQMLIRLGLCRYRAWHQPGSRTDTNRGGLLVAVRDDMRASLCHQSVGEFGNLLTLNLDAWLLTVVWRRPSPDTGDASFVQALAEHHALAHGHPWAAIGDWNWCPDEHVFLQGDEFSASVVMDENGCPRPTRREGRAIDYLIAQHLQAPEPSLDDEIFGDHFLFRVHVVQQDETLHSRRVMCPTASYLPPNGMSSDDWKAAVARAWGKYDVLVSSTEEEWQAFCAHAESAFYAASLSCRSLSTPPVSRPKGSLPCFVQAYDSRKRPLRRSFAARSMAKFCGRVQELRRLLALDQDTTAIRRKLDVHWPRDVPRDCPWPKVEEHAHRLLDEYTQAETRKVLQSWRAEMAKCGRRATRWLKQDHLAPTPSLWIETEPADIPEGKPTVTKDAKTGYSSCSVEENFHFLRTFWQRYWGRPCVARRAEVITEWAQAVGPTPRLVWQELRGSELAAVAASMAGSAAGPCGWTGDEAAAMPLAAWDTLAELCQRWLRRGQIPKVFSHMRQVHVPKQGALVQPGCADVAKLRPIVVQSVVWRIICSALIRRQSTRDWALQCVPDTCYGGLKGREALQAVIALAEHHAEHKGPIIALDLEKAFDTVDPRLALDVLARAGAPRQWLSLVKRVWLHQTRWIQYAGHTHETPAQVKRSIPQGDALSPLALILLLAAPVKDVEAHEAACGLLQSNFVDDRAASCRTAAQAHRYMQRWTRWSARFGLLENFDKMEVMTSERHFGELRRLGFAAKCLKTAIRVLGVDLTARLQDTVRPTAEKRNEEGKAVTARLMRMPASLHVKRKLWSSRVLSKISWGRGLRLPRADEISQFSSLYKRVTRRPSLASPWLTSLFEGPSQSHEFRAGFQAAKALWRAVLKRPMLWEVSVRKNTWQGEVRHWLSKLGWRTTAPWQWQHLACGYFDMSRPPRPDADHRIRESWRRAQFAKFLDQGRHELEGISVPAYCEQTVKRTSAAFRQPIEHFRGILTGAACSIAMQRAMRQQGVGSCCWCSSGAVPCWHHLAWQCSHFLPSRPPTPAGELQCRFGWMQHHDVAYGTTVLRHLAAVRQAVLDRVYAPSRGS